jgi:calcineurin-like phosphoesterase
VSAIVSWPRNHHQILSQCLPKKKTRILYDFHIEQKVEKKVLTFFVENKKKRFSGINEIYFLALI